jgi:hypothetical protein
MRSSLPTRRPIASRAASRYEEAMPRARTLLPLAVALVIGAGCRDRTPRPGPAPHAASQPASLPVAAPPPPPTAEMWRGVSLGLFGEDPDWSYDGLLAEIQALGATHVELVVPWYQRDVAATDIHPHTRFSPPDRTVLRTLRQAHARGLKVLLFPIVRLEDPGPKGDWRGTLKPRDVDAWFRSYERWLLALAALAQREGVAALSVGSELSTLDVDRPRWAALVERVRAAYRGVLTYSGNWDHYRDVKIYDLVDVLGVCGYFALGGGRGPSDVPTLTAAWQRQRRELEEWQRRLGKPFVFTELGYLSQKGTHAWPWREGADEPVDLDEQRRCYEAFARTWGGAASLQGVFFWNWYGWGGARSKGYPPRNKPAAHVIRGWFQAAPQGVGAVGPASAPVR